MFNKILKFVFFSALSVAIAGYANSDAPNQGKVVEAGNGNALVYFGTLSTNLKGQLLRVNRLLPSDSLAEGGDIYSYQEVGKVIFDGAKNKQYASVRVIEGKLQQGDVVDFNN